MSTVKPTTVPSKRLATSINASSSTFQLNNILGWDGNALTSADFGDNSYLVLRNDANTLMEIAEFDPTTVASTPITFLRRGLKFTGDRTTEVTANKLTWVKNETIVELGCDVPQLFQFLKEYIDAASIAGSVPASTVAAGIVVEASQAEVDAGTATKVISGTTYDLFAKPDKIRAKKYQDYAADAGSTDDYAITVTPAPAAYATGQVFVFKANTVNTGAATLNVNALGAKTIKKNATQDLDDGDIVAGEIVMVVYDAVTTTFQLQTRSSPRIPVVRTYAAGSSTWTKPTGLKYIVVEVQAAGGGGGGAANTGSRKGGDGAGGGYAKKTIAAATLTNATETVTVGVGGTAGANTGTGGGTGGTTSFGTSPYVSATGGTGGNGANDAAGVSGGIGSSGDFNVQGGAGSTGFTGGATASRYVSTPGGSSVLGGGGPAASDSGGAGQNGGAYGGGASGGMVFNASGAVAGGVGADGICIVTEYYN